MYDNKIALCCVIPAECSLSLLKTIPSRSAILCVKISTPELALQGLNCFYVCCAKAGPEVRHSEGVRVGFAQSLRWTLGFAAAGTAAGLAMQPTLCASLWQRFTRGISYGRFFLENL